MPSFPGVGHRQCRIPQRWLNSPNWPPGMVLTPKDPQIFGKAKSHQTHSYSQEARTLSPNLSASQSQDFILFFFLSNWLWWQNLYLGTFWAFWDVPYWFSRTFPLTAISRSYRHLLILFHTFLVQQSQLPLVEMSLVTGRDPYKQVQKTKAQWLIDYISKDYVPVYGSSQPHYPPWKWR